MNLDHLKQIAQNATQEPWSVFAGRVVYEVGDGHKMITPLLNRRDNAAHIAAFDPPTVLALITRIEELEAAVQRVRDARANHPEIPECDRYTDNDVIKCGWRSAIESIDQALEGDQT